MPQYPYTHEGPIIAERNGTFMLGQGDFRNGDGGYKDEGAAVLLLSFGDQRTLYLAKKYTANKWQHLAVVRKRNKFSLYLNGVRQTRVRYVRQIVGIDIMKKQ